MFAVVYLGGKQYKVREKDEIEVEKLDIEVGKNVKVNEVLLMGEEDGSDLKLGMPFVAGAHVECQVMEQGKGEKIRVFKFHAKKRYHRTQGHRQLFTLLKVLKISAVEKKTSAAKEEKMDAAEMEAPQAAAPKKVAAKKTTKKEE
jgi:large subunit ribosomal protein L21